ncbi:MAG: hypothetical protein IJ349_11075 [Clostridia bacterium]|nr:hypothetical protein [Clostridia bacterium]
MLELAYELEEKMNEYKKRKQIRKGYRRSQFIIFAARNIIGPAFKKICDIECDKVRIKEEPFILMANHGHNFDAAAELAGIRNFMRFVMSDHLTRKPIMRVLLNFLATPIIYHREKGSDSLYNEVVDNLNAGVNVAIHIEGGKTNNGETGYISKRNAQMVKDGNCALVTFRNKGGYLKAPRWAENKRSGKISGEVVRVYSRDELSKMSVDEIFEHIKEDLSFNIYDEQKINPQIYSAENPAESAEIILYACPKCKRIGTLKSHGDTLSCTKCDFKARVDYYGFWHSEDMPFDNIVEWDKFQKSILKEEIENKRNTSDLIFADSEQIIYTLENENRVLKSENGKVVLLGDCLEISGDDFIDSIPLECIKKISIASKMNLLIVTDKAYYEIHSKAPRSAIKYVVAHRYLMGKESY